MAGHAPKDIHYYVTFVSPQGGFDSTCVAEPEPLDTFQKVIALSRSIAEGFYVKDVTIINWKVLEKEQ